MPTQRSTSRSAPSEFGARLRQWRGARRMSQLALAVEAEVSSRHLSFLETGRAQPSREMVLLLAGVLDVPLRDRNALLAAAGFVPIYRETPLRAPEMAHVRRALDFMLRQQEPYPALVVDRRWNLLMQNAAAGRLFGPFLADAPADDPPNVMRLTFHPRGFRPYFTNWEALAGPLVQQLHRDVGTDESTRALLDELLASPNVPRQWRTPDPAAASAPLLSLALEKGDFRVNLFTTIATLGTPQDVTLQELRVECFFPADEATEALARRLAASAAAPALS